MRTGFIALVVAWLLGGALVPRVAAAPGEPVQASPPVGEPEAEAEDEREALRLDGVIVAANPADSVALLRRRGVRRGERLRLGQEYAGYRLVEVRRDSVLLESASGPVRLSLEAAPGPEPVGVAAAAADDVEPEEYVPAPADAGWIRRRFSRSRATERLEKEMPVILNETSLVPRVEEGVVRGIAVSRLPDGTLLSEAGLLPGDVLMSINGEPLHGLDALWEVLARLRNSDEILVLVDRRGETVRLAYALTN